MTGRARANGERSIFPYRNPHDDDSHGVAMLGRPEGRPLL
jgi:hypothetical protein